MQKNKFHSKNQTITSEKQAEKHRKLTNMTDHGHTNTLTSWNPHAHYASRDYKQCKIRNGTNNTMDTGQNLQVKILLSI